MVSMATCYMIPKSWGRPTKSIVSSVLLFLEHKTWYQIKAKTKTFLPMVRYVNYLICIFININENLKNEVKIIKKNN